MASMRGRFAPSPTGYIHLGNVWSAFLAWLQVRQGGGTLVLRIEDIDEQRSKAVYTKALMEDLSWLGLDWDEGPDVEGPYGPYVQQERYDRYDEALDVLREKGLLYPCYCSRTRLQAIGAPHAGEHTVYDGHLGASMYRTKPFTLPMVFTESRLGICPTAAVTSSSAGPMTCMPISWPSPSMTAAWP